MPNVFIGPFREGLQRDLKPFMLPNDAFEDLENTYLFRGRVLEKDGNDLLGRLHKTPSLPESKGTVATGASTFSTTLTSLPVSPGTVVIVVSTPGPLTFTDNGNGTLTCPAVVSNYGTINYQTGAIVLNFSPVLPGGGPFAVNATAYRFLPRKPVMGLVTIENPEVNEEGLLAFDQTTAYLYNTGTSSFDEITGAVWSGTDTDFFGGASYFKNTSGQRLTWVTNNVAYDAANNDGIKYFNGSTFANLQAQIDSASPNPNYLRGSLLVIPYRNRLVVLNTLEGPAPASGAAVRRQNRARWSQNGTPIAADDANAWRQDIDGRGGYIDAPTEEAIVSAKFFKDTLVVFFERSTWKLVYTGNELLPFLWYRVNSEFGAESTFASVTFDKGVYAIGDRRIIAATSDDVTSIDQKIPDEVFEFHNSLSGPKRIHGTRDFSKQLLYWNFPSAEEGPAFPNRLLVLNYVDGSYSFFKDTLTCFGTYQQIVDTTWATLDVESWADWTNPWNTYIYKAFFPSVVAGNHKGFVLFVNRDGAESQESMDLQGISNAAPAVFTINTHNLAVGSFVKFIDTRAFPISVSGEAVGTAIAGTTQFNGKLSKLGVLPADCTIVIGANTFVDLGNGKLSGGAGSSTINYSTVDISLNFSALAIDTPVIASYNYNILNARTFKVDTVAADSFTVASVAPDGSLNRLNFDSFGSPYVGSGLVEIVDNFAVRTKAFTPFINESQNFRLKYIDALLTRGNSDFLALVFAEDRYSGEATEVKMSSLSARKRTEASDKIICRGFVNTISNFIQLEFTKSDYQMTQESEGNFEMHSLTLNVDPAGQMR